MNAKFHAISLAVGGAHYPTVNANLQQKFGEAVVTQVLDKIIRTAESHNNPETVKILETLCGQILADFDMPSIQTNDMARICEGLESE